MSVAAATGAVSTQQHQPTPEQIRLAQLIDDKKHDQPEVQDIVRKVLDVVANSNQEDALLALFDCDYDYERTVALLIEKGHEVASEWRTATNHKMSKKQQQQKTALTKNGHGGEPDENGQQRDGFTYRGKSRGGRSRFQQQQNGGDSQNNNQQQSNDNYISQQRQRGGSAYRGRYRASNRGSYRGNDRNYQQQQYEQQPQDPNVDNSSPSDTTQRLTDVPNLNRRGGGRQQQQQQWDVGNWNGETQIYSRSTNDDEQLSNSENNNVSNTLHVPSEVTNGQSSSLGASIANNASEQKSKGEFDPVEAARQIKNVIGIGQSQQNAPPPKPLMDLKPLMSNQQQKSNIIPQKSPGQNLNTKLTPPPLQRIPHQPVIFSDRFDGGINKIDVQFGNLGESFEDTSSQHKSVPVSSSSSAFYQHSEPNTSGTKQNNTSSSVHNSQRTTTVHHQPTEQSAFVSPITHTNSTRPSEQQPMMNQQRILPPQMQQQQQPSMTMKPVVPPQYAVHHQQHQLNTPNLLLQSLLYHHQQQEPVPLDTSYDPTAFQLPSIDFNAPYFMATAMNQQPPQQQTQPRYLVSQPPLPPQQQQQQTLSNRQQSSTNVQTPSLSTSSSSVPPSSTSTTSSAAPKKGPAVPPGIFLSSAPPTQPTYSTYSTAYGVPPSVNAQQQTGAATYSTPYDAEHMFTNALMQLTNPQQAQSPSGTYGSVTPPVQQQNQQQQQQQTHNNNDNKAMNYRAPLNENLLLLQQYQQYAIQQSNSQQQGQQAAAHSPAQLSYFLGHPASGPNYSSGPQIMYAQPAATMTQQAPKQQAQQYNQNNSSSGIGGNDDYYVRGSSSNKEAQYMYAVPAQPQQVPSQSVGQQQGVNKQQQQAQQQQRASGNVYNNQQSQQRPFQ